MRPTRLRQGAQLQVMGLHRLALSPSRVVASLPRAAVHLRCRQPSQQAATQVLRAEAQQTRLGGGTGTPLQIGGGSRQVASGGQGNGSAGTHASGQPANSSQSATKASEDGANPHSQDTANDAASSAPVQRVRPPFVGDPSYGTPRPITGSKPVEPALDRFPEEARKLTDLQIHSQVDEMWNQGHAIDRHGPDITEGQLDLRAREKIDPMTMTREDGVNGGDHNSARHATQFTSLRAMAHAKITVENSVDFRNKLAEAKNNNRPSFAITGVSLEAALGPDYLHHVRGKTRVLNSSPPQVVDANLTNGHIVAVYKKDPATGEYKFYTLYPDLHPSIKPL